MFCEGGVCSSARPPAAAAFTIFQDDKEKSRWSTPPGILSSVLLRSVLIALVSFSAAAPHPALGGKPVRPLAEIQLASKPNVSEGKASGSSGGLLGPLTSACPQETPPELAPDESTMWGARYNSLAACPNSTSDFAMLAQFVSTPFACKTPHSSSFFQAEGRAGAHTHIHTPWAVVFICFSSAQRTAVATLMTMPP